MTRRPEIEIPDLFSTDLEGGRVPRPERGARKGRRGVPRGIASGLLAVVVVSVGLLPLYGDARAAPLTHPLWARMLLRGLGMDDAVRAAPQASQAFSFLAWRESFALPASAFDRANGIESVPGGAVTSSGGVGEVSYDLAVVRQGDYRLRVRAAGSAGTTATAQLEQPGGRVVGSFSFAPTKDSGWVMGRATYLDRGTYAASVLLPAGASLEYVEVAPPCLNAIEPPGGWNPTAVTTSEDVAVTVLKAIDREDALPPADMPIELTGADFQVEGRAAAVVPAASSELETRWLRAGSRALSANVFVHVPAAGLYTLSAFGVTGRGQGWMADGCRKAVVCADKSSSPGWRNVMTQHFQAGPHYFNVVLVDGAAVERVRLERKRDAPGDYRDTLRTLGFDVGPAGPITRDRAVEAMRYLGREIPAACGDVRLPEGSQIDSAGINAGGAAAPGGTGPGGAGPGGTGPEGTGPGGTGPAPGNPPVIPPILPSQQPSSPVLPQG